MDFLKFAAPFYVVGIALAMLIGELTRRAFGYSGDVAFIVGMAPGGFLPNVLMISWILWIDDLWTRRARRATKGPKS